MSKLAEINGTCSYIVSADLDLHWLWLQLLPDAMVEEDIVDVLSSPRSTFSNFRRCRNRLQQRSSRVRAKPWTDCYCYSSRLTSSMFFFSVARSKMVLMRVGLLQHSSGLCAKLGQTVKKGVVKKKT